MEKHTKWTIYREERVETVLSAAEILFLEQGIENVKMTDIAQKAGIGVASLYRYPATATKTRILISVGERLWQKLLAGYTGVFESKAFLSADGYHRIRMILALYLDLYAFHRDFIMFIDEFDAYCLENKVPYEELSGYEKAVSGFYEPYRAACERGMADGSVRTDLAVKDVYLAVNHSVLALVRKMARGAVLAGDDVRGADEIKILIEMFAEYLKK